MRYPDFFIVGAAKSGTTALWQLLGGMPGVFMTSAIQHKELSFFCNDYGLKDPDNYLSHFSGASGDQLIGEVCHTYLTSPESAQWIKSQTPDAKIVIILRNPAIRAFSLYQWMVMEGYEKINSFEKALEIEPVRISDPSLKSKSKTYFRNYFYFNSGLYADQVKRYLDVFGESKTLVLVYEEFKKDPGVVLHRICNHLGLSVNGKSAFTSKVVNESKSVRSPRLQYFLKNDAVVVLNKLRVPRSIRKTLLSTFMELNIRKDRKDMISPLTYKRLINQYNDDIDKLQNLIGLDLKKFWN